MIKTPQYVFDSKVIEESYLHMKRCLYSCDVYYAMKPNSEFEILEVLKSSNAKFEIASEGELNKLIKMNIPADRIICSLPVKKAEMIKYVYDYGCRYFVFDSIEELEKIKEYAPDSVKVLRVYTNDIIKNNIPFGMDINEINKYLMERSGFGKDIDGLTFYIRKNYNYDNLEKVLNRCEDILKLLPVGKDRVLNIGGNYRPENQAGQIFYQKLNQRLLELSNEYKLRLIAEVGRSVVKFAGKLYTKVELVKDRGDFYEVFIDAGLPTGISYAPKVINITNRDAVEYDEVYSCRFYGITCSHALLFEIQLHQKLQMGDILEFKDFGSYSICKHSNFHGWEKPLVTIK